MHTNTTGSPSDRPREPQYEVYDGIEYDGGLPVHLKMGVNKHGQGPEPDHLAVRFVCWTCNVDWPCPRGKGETGGGR